MSDEGLAKARKAWQQLATSGSATKYVTEMFSVGLDEHVSLFSARFFGADGVDTFKLVLGLNGEGKTHFLHCIEAAALAAGHVVAFVEAKNAGAAESPLEFAREVLGCLRVQTETASDDHPLLILLREAVARHGGRLEAQGLDAAVLLPEWADGFRAKNLQPFEFAQGLAEALHGVTGEDAERALSGIRQLSGSDVRVPKGEHNILGPKMLRSITQLPRLLGFNKLVLLIDEAEVAFEGLAQKRRQNLLGVLRFLNDHLVNTDDGAVVLVACTDDFWPAKFNEYAALKGRLSDPGHDRLEDRKQLTPRALMNKNKVWVRETFRGTNDDYRALGDALLVVGKRVLPDLDLPLQSSNATRLAAVASSDEVTQAVKRPFIKALAQLVESQVGDGLQAAIDDESARGLFDLAKRSILGVDSRE
jgi:hypothetical protein